MDTRGIVNMKFLFIEVVTMLILYLCFFNYITTKIVGQHKYKMNKFFLKLKLKSIDKNLR